MASITALSKQRLDDTRILEIGAHEIAGRNQAKDGYSPVDAMHTSDQNSNSFLSNR